MLSPQGGGMCDGVPVEEWSGELFGTSKVNPTSIGQKSLNTFQVLQN